MKRFVAFFLFLVMVVGVGVGCDGSYSAELPPALQPDPQPSTSDFNVTLDDFKPIGQTFSPIPIDVASLDYYNLINTAAPIEGEALTLLSQNGFVIDETYRWNRFVDAYAGSTGKICPS